MISSQVIQSSIDELKAITKVDLCVVSDTGTVVASTFRDENLSTQMIVSFAHSPADSQVIGKKHLLKVYDESEMAYIVIAQGFGEDVYMIGKIAASQIQNLIVAYKERYDRNNFFQNLLLDNMLLVDIYNRAKQLHVKEDVARAVFVIETKGDGALTELMKSFFTTQAGDYITAVDEKNVILIKALEINDDYDGLYSTASMIVDMINTELMLNAKVAYGTIIKSLKDVSKSYKEAKIALEVGKIFYAEKSIVAYHTLGIGRLIYQLPVNLCKIFIEEIFGEGKLPELDEETLTTINKFFENNLNVSETSRQLFVHRNTLVYRIEKLQKSTGLDVRTFDDALTFKIALMVVNYMKYLETQQN